MQNRAMTRFLNPEGNLRGLIAIDCPLTHPFPVSPNFGPKRREPTQVGIQGLPSVFDLMYLALADRNKQVRFGLKVVLES